MKDFRRRSPLVGSVRADQDRSLHLGGQVDSAAAGMDWADPADPLSSVRFEHWMRVAQCACDGRAKKRHVRILRLWCEGWALADLARMEGIGETRALQILNHALQLTRSYIRRTPEEIRQARLERQDQLNRQDQQGAPAPIPPLHPTRPRGENNTNSKLTETQVREIRQRRASGTPILQLRSDYGVSDRTIFNIVKRRAWRHVA